MKVKKNYSLQKLFSHKIILTVVSMVVHRKEKKKKRENQKKIIPPMKKRFYIKYSQSPQQLAYTRKT